MTIGEKIRKARKNKGLSQGDLADCIGINNVQEISRWEKGDRIPTKRLNKLVECLGISADWLMGGEDELEVQHIETMEGGMKEKYIELLERQNKLLVEKITELETKLEQIAPQKNKVRENY